MMPSIVVIGNAAPREDLSSQIDRCDIVIRFNCTPFFDTQKTGRKTTILSLLGLPYPRTAAEIPWELNPAVVESCQMIWAETPAFFAPLKFGFNILPAKLKLLALHHVHDRYAITYPASRIPHPVKRPSSGFQVLRYLVNSPAFAGIEKFICGFEFRGGPCHPWEQEKQQVARYLELGLLRSF